MNKKVIAAVVVIAIIIGVAVFMLTNTANGTDDMNVPIFESAPDKVVIYQGDMALVTDEMQIYSGKQVQVILPPKTVVNTVEVFDAGKKIEKFKIGSGSGAGQVNRASRTIKNLLSWKSNRAGARKIKLIYMMKGLSWTPYYTMKIMPGDKKAGFKYMVGVRNDSNLSTKVAMKLVSGEIGSPKRGSGIYYRQMTNAQFKLSAYDRQGVVGRSSSMPYIGATKINAHYTYNLPNASLEKQGITFITLRDTTLEAKKEFVWVTTTGHKVDIVYTLKNNTGQPFAEGLVNCFKNNVFMGSDVIEWTPSGGKGHVTIGGAVDLQAEKTVDVDYVKERGHRKEYRHRIALKVTNYSKKIKHVKVIDQKYPDCVEFECPVQPTSIGNNTYLWKMTLPPGKSQTIKYRFFSDSRYNKPYRAYN